MRIAHLMSWYVPGLGYQENKLPREQAHLGHDVDIIASNIFPESCRDIPSLRRLESQGCFSTSMTIDEGVRLHRLPGIERRGMTYMFGLRSKLEEVSPEILMAHGAFSPDTIRAISYSRSLGYKVFVDDHSLGMNESSRPFADSIYLSACRAYYSLFGDRVSMFLPVTSASCRVLNSIIPKSKSKSVLLPLGADTRAFSKSADARRLGRNELGLGDSDLLVISSGKLLPEKRMTVLLEAFAKVAETRPNMRLLIMGSGPESHMRELRDTIRRLGIGDRAQMREFVPHEQLPLYYSAADIGVWPGLPSITVVEAAATGLPIIVPDDETAYGVLREASAIRTYNAPSPVSLAEEIFTMVDDQILRLATSVNARKVVAERLSWISIAERTVRLFEDALDNRRKIDASQSP